MLENVCAKNKNELLCREGHYIKLFKCVNIKNPYGGDFNRKESHSQYYKVNKIKLSALQHLYYKKNKEQISQTQKAYNLKNQEHIRQRKNETIVCQCGSHVTRTSIARHNKSVKHQKYLKSIDNDLEYEYSYEDGTSCTKKDYEYYMT